MFDHIISNERSVYCIFVCVRVRIYIYIMQICVYTHVCLTSNYILYMLEKYTCCNTSDM